MLNKLLLNIFLLSCINFISLAQHPKYLTIKNIEYLITNGYIEKQLYLENMGFKIEQEDKNICAYAKGDSILKIKGEEFTIDKTFVVIFPNEGDIKINTCDRNQFQILFNEFKKGIVKSKKLENEKFYSFTYLYKTVYFKTYATETYTTNKIKIRGDVISVSLRNPD